MYILNCCTFSVREHLCVSERMPTIFFYVYKSRQACVYAQVSESCTLLHEIAIIKDYVGLQNVYRFTTRMANRVATPTMRHTIDWTVAAEKYTQAITSSSSRLTTFARAPLRLFKRQILCWVQCQYYMRRGLSQMREMWVLTSRCPSTKS